MVKYVATKESEGGEDWAGASAKLKQRLELSKDLYRGFVQWVEAALEQNINVCRLFRQLDEHAAALAADRDEWKQGCKDLLDRISGLKAAIQLYQKFIEEVTGRTA